MNYEKRLFEVAPWAQEVMLAAKTINQASFLRGRSGWIERNIQNAESIYEHTLKVALATYFLTKNEEEITKAVAHDLSEIFAPDRVPGEVPAHVKKAEEIEAIKKLSSILPNGNYWREAWHAFENENGILTELDKICPSIQAVDYLRTHSNNRLEDFYPYSRKKLQTPELIFLLDSVCKDNIPKTESAYIPYFKGLENITLDK